MEYNNILKLANDYAEQVENSDVSGITLAFKILNDIKKDNPNLSDKINKVEALINNELNDIQSEILKAFASY